MDEAAMYMLYKNSKVIVFSRFGLDFSNIHEPLSEQTEIEGMIEDSCLFAAL